MHLELYLLDPWSRGQLHEPLFLAEKTLFGGESRRVSTVAISRSVKNNRIRAGSQRRLNQFWRFLTP